MTPSLRPVSGTVFPASSSSPNLHLMVGSGGSNTAYLADLQRSTDWKGLKHSKSLEYFPRLSLPVPVVSSASRQRSAPVTLEFYS